MGKPKKTELAAEILTMAFISLESVKSLNFYQPEIAQKIRTKKPN